MQLDNIRCALYQVEFIFQSRLLLREIDAENRLVLSIHQAILKIEILAYILIIGHCSSREANDIAHLVIDRYCVSVTEHGIFATLTYTDETDLLQEVEVKTLTHSPFDKTISWSVTYSEPLNSVSSPSFADGLTCLVCCRVDLMYALHIELLRIAEYYLQRLFFFLLLLFLLARLVIVFYVFIEIFFCKFLAGDRKREIILQLPVEAYHISTAMASTIALPCVGTCINEK